MYSRPVKPDQLKKWRETWVAKLLSVAREENIHLVNKSDLKLERPFSRMDPEAFQDILCESVARGYGKWWDRKKERLRIYWCTLDKWAEMVCLTAKKKEKNVIDGTHGIIEIEPSLKTMPKSDLETILKTMVERGFARWVKEDEWVVKIV
jgi:hypothetical protein